jgi:hypothetical protein
MSLILFGNRKEYAQSPKRSGEAIRMQAKRFGYFPRTFVWRGREYNVEAVERCWTTGSRRNGGQMQRHYFQVRCPEGKFDLYQVIAHNTWHIARLERY